MLMMVWIGNILEIKIIQNYGIIKKLGVVI